MSSISVPLKCNIPFAVLCWNEIYRAHLDFGVANVNFFDFAVFLFSWSICNSIAQKFTMYGISVWRLPCDVYRRRRWIVSSDDGWFTIRNWNISFESTLALSTKIFMTTTVEKNISTNDFGLKIFKWKFQTWFQWRRHVHIRVWFNN